MAISTLSDYEATRLENIKRNKALVQDLGIERAKLEQDDNVTPRPIKKRKIAIENIPTRSSARVASSTSKPSYNENDLSKYERLAPKKSTGRRGRSSKVKHEELDGEEDAVELKPAPDVEDIRNGWSAWTANEGEPARDDGTKKFHFESDPTFTPNKSPEEMLREGCFGGSYFRPLKSRRLGIIVEDDWKELPESWTSGLNTDTYLTNPEYEPEVNKFKVKCGQSIEEWEAAGWIAYEHDIRGWFQWYCRFFMGRRCDDDERQISRWRKCVGPTGRWRLALLRKYVKLGVRDVFDDGEDGEDAPEVSPVIHQTCQQWAYEVRQDDLEAFWRNGR